MSTPATLLLPAIERDPLWKKCYPRRFNEPQHCGQFYSAKEVGFQMYGIYAKIAEGYLGESEQVELTWASLMAKYRMPIYWVGSDMAQAIMQTTPPMEFNWLESPMPLETMALMVPKGTLLHEDKREVEAVFVAYCRSKKEEQFTSFVPTKEFTYLSKTSNNFTVWACTAGGHLLHWNFSDNIPHPVPVVDLGHIDKLVQEFEGHDNKSQWRYHPAITEEDSRFMVRVSHFVFGAILLMLSRPDLVTQGAMEKKVVRKLGKGQHELLEYWQPTILGEHYCIRREDQGGSHASPRFHWVRGFHRLQHFGQGRSQSKIIWVEPFKRGLNE